MGAFLGLLFGIGAALVWRSGSRRPPRRVRQGRSIQQRIGETLAQAGIDSVTPAQLLASSAGLAVMTFLLAAAVSRTLPIAIAFALFAALGPASLVRYRQRKRRTELRDLWPEAVDNLASAVRAGLSLPEALTQLGVRGPEDLRRPFQRFGEDYRASGRFSECLDRLKTNLADPTGDRIVESLRLARDVGGTDLGRLLRTLSAFLREDARTRAELETRQGWSVNGARIAVAAPWLLLAALSLPSAGCSRVQQFGRCSGDRDRRRPFDSRLPSHDQDWPAARRRTGVAMSALAGLALGGLTGAGATFAIYGAPRSRRPRLEDRLGPYLRDAPRRSSLLSQDPIRTPFPTLERILRPIMGDATRLLNRMLGGMASTRRRLVQVGRGMSVEEFRSEQVLWGAVGLLVGVGCSLLMLAGNPHRSPVLLLVLCGVTTLAGVVARDFALTQEVGRREQRMLAEFPTVAEMLALAVGAGEGPVGALERVTRTSKGELAKELATALAEARAGATLVASLENIAARTSLPTLARFVDGVAVAVERGTPLAEVLRAQAVDVREAGKRALLESGGKKEVAMMVPVVFFILPVTMLFALFPGFVSLQLLA